MISGQNIGLEGDVLDGLDDGADLGGGAVNVPGGLGELLHLGIGLGGEAGGLIHQVGGVLTAHGAGLYLGGDGGHVGQQADRKSVV